MLRYVEFFIAVSNFRPLRRLLFFSPYVKRHFFAALKKFKIHFYLQPRMQSCFACTATVLSTRIHNRMFTSSILVHSYCFLKSPFAIS